MLWLILIVAFSPVLAFKGLTLEILWNFFNLHPFWFMFLVVVIIRSPFDSVMSKIDEIKKGK